MLLCPQEEQVASSPPSIYSSFLSNGLLSPTHRDSPPSHDPECSQSQVRRGTTWEGVGGALEGRGVSELLVTLLQTDGELSGLPTPSPSPCPSPELPVKSPREAGLQPHQHERNHNCNNAAAEAPPGVEAAPPPAEVPPSPRPPLGFVAVVGTAGPAPRLFANGTLASHLHLPEEPSGGGTGEGGGKATPWPRPPPLTQPAGGVSALDELLQHIQEVAASGSGGIKVLTSCSTPSSGHAPSSLFSRGLHPHRHPQTRPHHYNQHQPAPSLLTPPPSLSPAPSSGPASKRPLQEQVIPERARPGGGRASVSRHQSQRRPPLVRMGGGLPRHHSFQQRGAGPGGAGPPLPFLARMNSNSSSNGPLAPSGGAAAAPPAACCLTRQHSYSGGKPLHQRVPPLLRRTLSLKPQVPPKPLFLHSAAAAAAEGGRGLCTDRLPESQ